MEEQCLLPYALKVKTILKKVSSGIVRGWGGSSILSHWYVSMLLAQWHHTQHVATIKSHFLRDSQCYTVKLGNKTPSVTKSTTMWCEANAQCTHITVQKRWSCRKVSEINFSLWPAWREPINTHPIKWYQHRRAAQAHFQWIIFALMFWDYNYWENNYNTILICHLFFHQNILFKKIFDLKNSEDGGIALLY